MSGEAETTSPHQQNAEGAEAQEKDEGTLRPGLSGVVGGVGEFGRSGVSTRGATESPVGARAGRLVARKKLDM